MWKKTITALCLGTALLMQAAAPVYGPMIRAARAVRIPDGTVSVDGRLQEPVWRQTEWQGDWHLPGTDKVSPYPAAVAFAYDADNLYVGVRIAVKVQSRQERLPKDHAKVWGMESVELFLANPENLNAFRQFVVNAAGNLWDGQDGDGFINFNFSAAAQISEDGWTAEFAVPWKTLAVNPAETKLLRVNLAHTVWLNRQTNESRSGGCWSLHKKGYREPQSFGFVLLAQPHEIFAKMLKQELKRAADFAGNAQVKTASDAAGNADPEQFIDALNCLAGLRSAVRQAESRKASRTLAENSRKALLFFPWDEMSELEKNTAEQRILLVKLLKEKLSGGLNFRMAVNEFAHEGFLLAGAKALARVSFQPENLRAETGAEIPASRITVQQIRFLEPAKELWPAQYNSWSKRPLPELVEDYDTPFAIGKFELQQFRLLIDSADAEPGKYSGNLKIAADGQEFRIPVFCEILPIVLPDSRKNPFNAYIFSQIPYGGKSGRAWAKLFREHYVNWVSLETPRVSLNGVRLIPPGHVKNSQKYLDGIVNSGIDFSRGKLTVDGEFGELADRLKIFAEFGLKPVMSTRTDDLYPETFPAVIDFFKSCGIREDGYIYKTGDEDTSLWQMPLAKRIHEVAPSVPLYIITSGSEYWDMKPLMSQYRMVGFTRAGLSAPEFEPDLRLMQKKGVELFRYTNRTSWAERDCRLAGRDDLWNVMIQDKVDGYQVWTAGVTGAYHRFRIGYGGSSEKAVHDFPPERQSTCQLLYIRKNGDFYKPVSCIRLEDMRDGITDYFYYRLAEEALAARRDAAAAVKLVEITAMPRKTPAQFKAIREKLIRLILGK